VKTAHSQQGDAPPDRARIVVLDNYDSFTWNLVQALEAAGGPSFVTCHVYRSDKITVAEVRELDPHGIVLSPGPFGPDQAGICADVVRELSDQTPILGVCLGMQVIAEVAGAKVRPSGRPIHGKTSVIRHDNRGLLQGLPNPFHGGRYHSLIVDSSTIPSSLEVSAWSTDGHIMGCRMRDRMVEGVLFHPESFLTEQGSRIFENFLASMAHVV
jgi:anthranilate synthase component 2